MIATNNGGYPLSGLPAGEALRAATRGGAPAPEDLRRLQDRATREALDRQAAAGLDLLTDGLVRREDPTAVIVSRLRGMRAGEVRGGFPGSGRTYSTPVAESEVVWSGPILVEDFLFASSGAPMPVKVVLPGPFTLACLAEDRAYGDPMALATALASAMNQELRALQAAGAAFLQIDEPALPERADDFPVFTRIWEVLGRGIGATLALHLEGGNLARIYPGVASLKRLGCLSLDLVGNPGALDLLRTAPPPETLRIGLGVVDGRTDRVETVEEILARIGDGRGLPPPDRLLLGTASDLCRLDDGAARAKLEALAGAARRLERA